MIDVPCEGCTACCRGLVVLLQPDEVALFSLNVPTYGPTDPTVIKGYALAHKPSGECAYLGPVGCTVHDHKPSVCAKFDCANLPNEGGSQRLRDARAARMSR